MSIRTLLRLNQATVYQSNHSMQERDASLVLQQFKSRIRWKDANKILDIGCGPGDFTVNYLLPLAPRQVEVTGIDISPAMIQLANATFSNDSRLKFFVGDVTETKFGQNYANKFNTIFSFYCLHWIQNQRAAMDNIYDALKPGGETLLVFLASSPVYLLYEIMSKKPRWSTYMQDYQEYVSPYHYTDNPEYEAKNLLSEAGFKIKDCFCSPMSYTMPSIEVLYNAVKAVNPFLNRIPEYLHEDYHEECKKEIFSNKRLTISNRTGEVSFSYSLMTVFASKPVHIS